METELIEPLNGLDTLLDVFIPAPIFKVVFVVSKLFAPEPIKEPLR